MNTLILDFLNSYADNTNPQYAVMLKGKWGCGKTHLIKEWKKRFDGTADTDEEITLKPIYISTYGMDSVNDIKTAIDRELNPFFYSKTGRFIKGVLKLAGKVVFKTSMDFNEDSKEDGSFSATLDSLSLLQVKDDSIKGVKFLIFDDIERCLIEMKELLGFINYFVEHCNCHVVVIGDENHLEKLPKAVLDEFKEKTIGKEFEIQPDIEEAIEYFLGEVPVSDYLKEMRDFIIACFKCTKSDNLRVLRQCLYDFKSHLNKLPPDLVEKDNIFLKNILGSFIAVYAEYNNSENKEVICNWSRDCRISLLQDNNEDKQRIQHLREKYHSLNKELIYDVLNPEYVTAIIHYIITGAPLVEFIVTEIRDKQKELKPWEMLSGFFDMEQQKLESICQDTIKSILDREIKDAYQLGYSIAYLSYFHAIGIFYFIQAYVSLIKVRIAEIINSQTSLEELYQLRGLFISGCNYVTTDSKTSITDDIGRNFMQRHQALNLHDENPDYRMVVECAFEEYQEAFIKGYATQEDVQFVAVLAITMTLTAKHLFLKLGDGAPYLAAADLGRIYSISQSTVAATNRILLQKLELKPLADAEGEVLIQTAVVLDFLRSLNEWVISYGHAPETRNIITQIIPVAIGQYILLDCMEKN